MKLEISITQDILNRSAACSENAGQNCAIALAIFDIFGARSGVGTEQIIILSEDLHHGQFINDHKVIARIDLPYEAQSFIVEFDESTAKQRIAMEPFAFEIEIPDNVIELVNIDEIYKVLETSTCLKLVEA